MPERHSLDATPRTIHGKKTKRLRNAGQVPGVVYGPVVADPVSVAVETRELDRMYQAYGSNYLINLKLDDTTYTVYMRHVVIDRLKRQPLHAEFYAPNMNVEITASVAVIFVGEPGNPNGVLTHGRDTIEVRGLPDDLPAAIEVDLAPLEEFGQMITVGDVAVPGRVEVLAAPEEMLIKIDEPVEIVEEEPEPEITEEMIEEAAEAGGAEGTGVVEGSGADTRAADTDHQPGEEE